MSAENPQRFEIDRPENEAAQWLARRDRGLTAIEQDGYLQWLRENPRNPAAILQHEAALKRLGQLKDWQPAQSSEPDPDLFAPPPRRKRWLIPAGVAAAIGIALGIVAQWRFSSSSPAEGGQNSYLVVNDVLALPDGSTVELNNTSRVTVDFTAAERRVHLVGEEAHFKVAKNPARPFLVEAGGLIVRAVGTAFDVRVDATSVDVLVTEGRVRLEQPPAAGRPSAREKSLAIGAGQRMTVSRSAGAPPPSAVRLTPEEITEALAWQKPRLQFYETRLADAVAEFNRHNRRRLLLGDPALSSTPIGGTFRVDNIEAFARLLEVTLGLRAELQESGDIVLTRERKN